MKYAVDRIEENIVVLEKLDDKTMIELKKEELPKEIKDGTILVFKDNKYELDLEEEKNKRQSILERFNRLKKN